MSLDLRQGFGFLAVGGLSAALDAGGFVLLTHFGVSPGPASAVSFCLAFFVNYYGNREFVFQARSVPGSLRRYLLLVLLNLGLSAGIVMGLVAIGLHPWAAKAASMLVIAVLNFWFMRNWVFSKQTDSMPQG